MDLIRILFVIVYMYWKNCMLNTLEQKLEKRRKNKYAVEIDNFDPLNIVYRISAF